MFICFLKNIFASIDKFAHIHKQPFLIMKRQIKVDTPLGLLYVVFYGTAVVGISFTEDFNIEVTHLETSIDYDVAKQLSDYFEGKRTYFDFAVELIGSKFQQVVWLELMKIPYGTVTTYGEIARRIGKPLASRAVGMACNRNPLLLVVPCHRVVGANGKLVGFACGMNIKKYLLDLEKS